MVLCSAMGVLFGVFSFSCVGTYLEVSKGLKDQIFASWACAYFLEDLRLVLFLLVAC